MLGPNDQVSVCVNPDPAGGTLPLLRCIDVLAARTEQDGVAAVQDAVSDHGDGARIQRPPESDGRVRARLQWQPGGHVYALAMIHVAHGERGVHMVGVVDVEFRPDAMAY